MQEEERMRATLDASRIIYGTRERLAELFHAEDASRIAFTANVTESLNIAIQGLFEPGDHVITSVCEHNSVLRPLYLMEQRGVKVTYLPADSKGRIAYDELENAYEPETKADCNHACVKSDWKCDRFRADCSIYTKASFAVCR